jgi:hypothetical protein
MSTESERMQILSMIESSKITPSQGVKLLQALDDSSENMEFGAEDLTRPAQTLPYVDTIKSSEPVIPVNQPPKAASPDSPVPPASSVKQVEETNFEAVEEIHQSPRSSGVPDFNDWRRWSMISLWIGVIVTILASVLLYTTWMAARGPGFWLACAWLPFLIGIGLIVLGWSGLTVRWMHVRIQQNAGEWPQNIAISIPLPFRLMAWLMRIFGGHIPGGEGKRFDEMILALKNTSPETPFYLDVNKSEDGERVQIFIG